MARRRCGPLDKIDPHIYVYKYTSVDPPQYCGGVLLDMNYARRPWMLSINFEHKLDQNVVQE